MDYSRPLFLYFCLFDTDGDINKFCPWLDLWHQKRPPFPLSHTNCPWANVMNTLYRSIAMQCHAEIKHSDWLSQVPWLFLTNQKTLFHPSLATPLWNLFLTSLEEKMVQNSVKLATLWRNEKMGRYFSWSNERVLFRVFCYVKMAPVESWRKLTIWSLCAQSYKHFTLVIYNSRGVL